MAIIIPVVGEVELLKRVLGISVADSDVVIKLYKNDYTPNNGTTVSNFVEPNDSYYEAITVNNSVWEITAGDISPATPTSAINQDEESPIDFIFNEYEKVYGYFVTNSNGDLLWAERFDAPIDLGQDGGTITIVPRMQLTD